LHICHIQVWSHRKPALRLLAMPLGWLIPDYASRLSSGVARTSEATSGRGAISRISLRLIRATAREPQNSTPKPTRPICALPPPLARSDRLEALKGDRAGQYSVRINMQWRICFEWPRGAAGPSRRDRRLSLRSVGTMSRPAIHPGEILAEELAELGVTPTELARQLKVPANRISQIIQGKRSISGDTALRLGHWFGTTGQFWLNLQSAFEIRVAA
jgi:addiction module HigA family antidote